MGKYMTVVRSSYHSPKAALDLALEAIMDSELVSFSQDEGREERLIYGEFGPGRTEYYKYYKATVVFLPGEKYLEDLRKKEELAAEERFRKEEIARRLREEKERRDQVIREARARKKKLQKEKRERFKKKIMSFFGIR